MSNLDFYGGKPGHIVISFLNKDTSIYIIFQRDACIDLSCQLLLGSNIVFMNLYQKTINLPCYPQQIKSYLHC